MTAKFIPALHLSQLLSTEIEPTLRRRFPNEAIALAFLGSGSDVLGFDTARSMDHDWGPRLTIVVADASVGEVSEAIDRDVDSLLPATIGGFPSRFSHHEDGTLYPDKAGKRHRLEVISVESMLRQRLLIEDLRDLDDAVWLSTPMQSLLELTSGAVFVDDTGELTKLRETLAFYPEHLWRYQLSGYWMRISQVNPFIGRSGEVGDETGSALLASSIARDLMQIGLLQSRRYAPYPKWLGTAFALLPVAVGAGSHLLTAVQATSWKERETAINDAGSHLIRQLNSLQIIPHVNPEPQPFHSRPFMVLPAEQIAQHLRDSLQGSRLLDLQATMGGIDVITDSTDARGSNEFRLALRSMFTSAFAG